MLRLWRVEQTSTDRDGAMLEHFPEPQDLDFNLLPDDPPTLEGNMMAEHGFGTFGPRPAVFRVESVEVEDLQVAGGATEGAFPLRFGLGGDFYPAGGPIELASPRALP